MKPLLFGELLEQNSLADVPNTTKNDKLPSTQRKDPANYMPSTTSGQLTVTGPVS